jgi:hypothetical protein
MLASTLQRFNDLTRDGEAIHVIPGSPFSNLMGEKDAERQ